VLYAGGAVDAFPEQVGVAVVADGFVREKRPRMLVVLDRTKGVVTGTDVREK
jgi:hypothetical protein